MRFLRAVFIARRNAVASSCSCETSTSATGCQLLSHCVCRSANSTRLCSNDCFSSQSRQTLRKMSSIAAGIGEMASYGSESSCFARARVEPMSCSNLLRASRWRSTQIVLMCFAAPFINSVSSVALLSLHVSTSLRHCCIINHC